MHSSHILRDSGLSSAQVLLLRAIQDNPRATTGQLAEEICLSHATTTTILNRLESGGLITRHRSENDRRKVHVKLTEQGVSTVNAAPLPLQQHFIERFEKLKDHERTSILSTLQRVAEMMESPEKDEEKALEPVAIDQYKSKKIA